MSWPVFHLRGYCKNEALNCAFIFLTCDSIHLLLRTRGVARDLSDGRERDVGVQVQAQHEIMHLVRE